MNDAQRSQVVEARILDLATLRDRRPATWERTASAGARRRPRPSPGPASEVEALARLLLADCAAIRADLVSLAGRLSSWAGR